MEHRKERTMPVTVVSIGGLFSLAAGVLGFTVVVTKYDGDPAWVILSCATIAIILGAVLMITSNFSTRLERLEQGQTPHVDTVARLERARI